MNKRILVCAYFAKNIGDDLFLKVLFDRYPGASWDLLTANRNYPKIFKEYKNVKIIYSYRDIHIGGKGYNMFFKMNDLLLKYKKYDAVVHIGGSIFMQGPAWKQKLNERAYLVNNFKRMNKKAFVLGANFGPFKDVEFTNIYKDLFKKYDDICFRDSYSLNHFNQLKNVRVAPDVVLSLNVQECDIKEKVVGFSTINLESREGLKDHTQQYNDKMVSLIESYAESGYQVKLFSFCENEGDLKGIHSLNNSVNTKFKKNINIVNYTGDLDYFLAEFKSCEIIIGTRFHSIILAMLYNQSFYPIIYSEKTYNFLKDLGIQDNCCYIEEIEKLNVKQVMEISKTNKMTDKSLFVDAHKQFEKLDEFMIESG